MEKSKICLILLTISLFASSTYAKNKLSAVTATADLADFVRNIGGDKVEVVSLSVGNQDLHAVEPRPSMVMKVKKAGLLVRVGMDIDLWMQGVIEASRNKNVMRDAKGYLDASLNIHKLEVPEGKIDASMGDIHIYGNPHYLYGPENAAPILKAIKSKLSELSPENKEYFQENCNEYSGRLGNKINEWKAKMEPFKGMKIVTYHNSWPYFAKMFDLKVAGCIEPKPGIPPSPAHINDLVEKMRSENVKTIIIEPYYNVSVAESIAKKAGAKVVVLPPSVGGVKGVDTYIDLFDYNVNKLVESLR